MHLKNCALVFTEIHNVFPFYSSACGSNSCLVFNIESIFQWFAFKCLVRELTEIFNKTTDLHFDAHFKKSSRTLLMGIQYYQYNVHILRENENCRSTEENNSNKISFHRYHHIIVLSSETQVLYWSCKSWERRKHTTNLLRFLGHSSEGFRVDNNIFLKSLLKYKILS